MEEIRETFFIECEELLETLEAGLIAIESKSEDDDTVNAVFRAVHSIKGGAGAFGLDHLVNFAHKFENVLDLVRSEKIDTSSDVISVLLRSSDVLSDLVSLARDRNDQETPKATELLAELLQLTDERPNAGKTAKTPTNTEAADLDLADPVYTPAPLDLSAFAGTQDDDAAYAPLPMALPQSANRFAINFRPHPRLYELGNETTLLLRALTELGTVQVTAQREDAPLLDKLDLAASHVEFRIEIETTEEQSAIEEVFEFVDTECDLAIVRLADTEEECDNSRPDDTDAPSPDETPAEAVAVVGYSGDIQDSIPVGTNTPQPDSGNASSNAPRATVRVDIERVDRLVNLVGELVITQAGISEVLQGAAQQHKASDGNTMEEFKQLTRELQDCVMALRTQPVKTLFQRMQRIARESAAASNKTVGLKTFGESTEIDKTVIERLADPLTHMIRNAIDHGIESAADRVAKGKPATGSVHLTAVHRSGRVVIEVSDDGAGINRDRVRAKAIEKGLISPDANLSNSDVDNLLFAPGFSTASVVTSLSGRGVGMDVVKRSIQALGGRITIQSQPNQGTTFSISLPLTLAVLDGMIVEVDQHTVVIPLTAILETHKPSAGQIHKVAGEGRVLSIRGNYVPLIDVGSVFAYRPPVQDLDEQVVVLVETEAGQRAALIVDRIIDQRQVVIKGLERNYGRISGVAAATVLGNGSIALILDTDDLLDRAIGPSSSALSQVA